MMPSIAVVMRRLKYDEERRVRHCTCSLGKIKQIKVWARLATCKCDDVFCFWRARTSRVKVALHKLKLGRGTGCGIGRIEF